MMNRICGDCRVSPDAFSALTEWYGVRQSVPAVPLVVETGKPALREQIGTVDLRRLNGWTHLQLAASIKDLSVRHSPLIAEEMTADTVDAFATIHSDAFHTAAERQGDNNASFSGLIAGGQARGFLVRIDGTVVAGAIVYFASNAIASLGTAATRRGTWGQGCHSALIGCRIAAARERGSQFIAVTAGANSQSRRNLERFGLVASHIQALYTPRPLQQC